MFWSIFPDDLSHEIQSHKLLILLIIIIIIFDIVISILHSQYICKIFVFWALTFLTDLIAI